mgnify:CR=1 FL=1
MLSLTDCVWDFQNNALWDIAGTTWRHLTNHDHSLQKSSANPLSLFIYKLTGSRSLENQPITANLSKIALYWHS